MSLATRWDAIVIGGGHNGLIAAAYLARAGVQTLVLERREIVGGAAVTEEVVPGYRFSRAAYVNSLLRPQIIRELELARHGLELLPRNPSSFTPTTDGRHLLLGSDAEANRREIAKFSERDAEAFPRYEALLERFARFVEPALDRAPPPIDSASLTARTAAWFEMGRTGLRALKLGRDLPRFLEMLTAPAERVLRQWFESEPLLGTLGTDAIIGAMASPGTPGSGYVLFHHVMGETNGARGVWAYVRGGMGRLSESIASAAREAGATVVTECPVAAIETDGERATGVRLVDGRQLEARTVLSSADPHVTFGKLLDGVALPQGFRDRIAGLDFSSGATKINVAVDRIPQFVALSDGTQGEPRVGPEHHGTIHLNSTLEEVDRAYRDALAGRASERPVIEMTIPSSLDDTLAPPGHHVVSLFVQYTPYDLAEGSWKDAATKEAFADRVFAEIERYCPGFTDSVVGRDVLTPSDLEEIFALTRGNIFHGAMTLDQLFWLRPAPGWSSYRTPLRDLYLCGSGAHPGGGVLGAPGRNAALVARRDLGAG